MIIVVLIGTIMKEGELSIVRKYLVIRITSNYIIIILVMLLSNNVYRNLNK